MKRQAPVERRFLRSASNDFCNPIAGGYNGSTDIYAVNGFQTSFGSDVSGPETVLACVSGSTDIYGVNGFLVSFGPPVSRAATDLAEACQSPKTVVR